MNAVATAVLVELAKDFISLVREIAPNWASAYYRFRSGGRGMGQIPHIWRNQMCPL